MTQHGEDLLAAYLQVSDARLQERVQEMIGALTDRERLLVEEAAVMGYVRGAYPGNNPIRRDSEILVEVLAACDGFRDLYPTLTGYEPEEHPEDQSNG